VAIGKLGCLVFAAMFGSALLAAPASAMPASGMARAAKQVAGGIQEVRWTSVGRRGVGWHDAAWRRGAWRSATWRGVGWRTAGTRWGWRRPLYGYAGWNRWGWGWRRPLYAAAGIAAGVGLAAAAYNDNTYSDNAYVAPASTYAVPAWNAGWNQQTWLPSGGSYYAYAVPAWNVGWSPGWRGWGWSWRRPWW